MNADFRLQLREQPFQGIVCIGKAELRPVIERPKKGHVSLYAEVCAAQSGTHVWWRFLLDSLVVNTLIQNILILVIPFIECPYKALFVHLGDVVDKVEQSLGCLYVRILGDVMADGQHLMELAELDGDWEQCFCQAFHPVNDNAIDPEAI